MPLLQPGSLGLLFVLGLWRWRRVDTRLLIAMACLPQLPFWADQLPLALTPEIRREVIWTVIVGGSGIAAYQLLALKVVYYVPAVQPYALLRTYQPALIIVLTRRNVGSAPAFVEIGEV